MPAPNPPDSPAIIVRNVSETRTGAGAVVHALKGASSSMIDGGVSGLLGPDGTGKTTLVSISPA